MGTDSTNGDSGDDSDDADSGFAVENECSYNDDIDDQNLSGLENFDPSVAVNHRIESDSEPDVDDNSG
jgi:hypothetical protein